MRGCPGMPEAIARASRAAEATAAAEPEVRPTVLLTGLGAGLSPDRGLETAARNLLSPLAPRCCGLDRRSMAPCNQPGPESRPLDPCPSPPEPLSPGPLMARVRPLILPAGKKKSPVGLWKGCHSLSVLCCCCSAFFDNPMHTNEACCAAAAPVRYDDCCACIGPPKPSKFIDDILIGTFPMAPCIEGWCWCWDEVCAAAAPPR